MKPFKLPEQNEKADFVLRQFDRIARRYDLANDVISLRMHRRWKSRALDKLDPRDGGAYLDVCTGTGDLALMLAARQESQTRVTGLDFSENMLSVARAREKTARERRTIPGSISWVSGDAQNLPFEDGSFDGAIISFGLRNLTDLQGGLDEMARVVKPGGKVVNLDLGAPTTPVFTPAFFFFFDRLVPLIGELLQGDRQAYTYLPESRKTYPKPEALCEMFQQAGLIDVSWQPLSLGSVALHVGTVSGQRRSAWV